MVSWVDWSILDAVSVDFSYIKIILDFLNSRRDDMISYTPDTISLRQTLLIWLVEAEDGIMNVTRTYRIVQGLPEAAFYQGDDATRSIRCSAVVLA